jgi:hypothetical protein
VLALVAGCDHREPGPDPDDPNAPRFEFGHLGQKHFPDGFAIDPLPFDLLEEGDEVEMIAGGQGLEMFALPIRAENFYIDIANEEWPMLDVHVDVENHNDGVGGHFTRLANYPVWFDEVDEETYEFFYLTVILPGDVPLTDLVGLPATIEAELEPVGEDPIPLEVDFVIGAAP